MKRIFAAILCVAMVLTMSTVTAFASREDSSVLKLPEDDGTGYPVIGISGDSYKNNNATKLVVPENIIRLGEGVFIGCSNLEQIKLHDKIQVIGERAFEQTAYYDDKDNWEDGVLYIGDALIKADPEKITEKYSVREGTRIIADGAFKDCKKLNSTTIPNTVEYVGTDAFAGTAFFESKENWSNNMLVLGHALLSVDKNYAGAIAVPEGIITIADGAFKDSKLTKLTTPDSLKYIGYNAFWDCRNLTIVNIGKSVETLGRGPFRMCTELSEIFVHEENENFAIVDGVLYNNQLSAVIRCPHKLTGNIVIPRSVTKINAYAFEWCTEIESVDIPEGCVFIGNSAFSVCENLSDVILPENMEYIDDYAFSYCNSIESITVPDNVYYLGKYAFTCCMELKEVILGNKITVLKEGLFESAEKLNTVSLGDDIEEISDSAFRFTKYISNVSKYKNGLLIASDKYLIKVAQDVTNCTIPYGVTVIADGALENLSEAGCIKEIHVPSTIKHFNWKAFYVISEKTPVYYSGTWKKFVSISDFNWDCINLHTTDFKTAIWSVVTLSGVLIIFVSGMVVYNHFKKHYEQETETEEEYDEE